MCTVTIRKNSGADVGAEQRLNFIEGTGITLTVTDDSANGEVDITIASSGGYTDEQAQDAVGTILVDSATIDFTYDDAANTITAVVKDGSITPNHLEGMAVADSTFSPGAAGVWLTATKTYSDLAAAATSNDIEVFSLPAGCVILAAYIIHTTQFSGGLLTSYTISLGKTGSATQYTSARSVSAAPTDTPTQSAPLSSTFWMENYNSSTSIRLFASSMGANLNAATQGIIKVGILVALAK